MSGPLVTVITVAYNSGKFIRDAIETVLAQSYQHLQYIVADDCSRDNTWEIINQYKDPRITAYRNEKNLGEYPNRNKAIELATGEYLIFIDGDDMIYPHAIEFMVKMMENFPDCAFALSYRYRNDFFYPVKLSPADFHRANFLQKGFNDTAFTNTFFRTKELKAANNLPTEFMAGDTYIRLKLALEHPVLLLNDGLTWWRETPGQASERLKKNFRKNLEEYYVINIEFIETGLSPLSVEEKEMARDNMRHMIKYNLWRALMRLQFDKLKDLLGTIRKLKIGYREILSAKKKTINVFEGYDSTHILKEPLEKNPFAVSVNLVINSEGGKSEDTARSQPAAHL